jgi:[ribosomal protein S5]-alanine N-acetyltransferase
MTPPVTDDPIRLRPVVADDLAMFRRFLTEPELIGPDWNGFRDPAAVDRRFAEDGYLGDESGRFVVDVDGERAGLVSYLAHTYTNVRCWNIGIALLPEFRGRGIGWRAQSMLTDYLFTHTPAVRVEAGTQAGNIAEQKSLEKAGFRREGVFRAVEFSHGRYRDGVLYSRIRDGVESS